MNTSPTTSPTAPSAVVVRVAYEIFDGHISAPTCERSEYVATIAAIIDRAMTAPEQIADALQALAKRDSVAIHVRAHYGQPASFHVVEVSHIGGKYLSRDGVADDYAAALSACRAAEFGNGGTT